MRLRPLLAVSALLNVFALSALAQPTLASISVSSSTTCAASPAVTVMLTGPAPAGGLAIQLASSVPEVIAIAPSVTVAGGNISATVRPPCFPNTTNSAVTLTATAGGISRSAVVNVLAPVLQSITISGQTSSVNLTGTVTLATPAVRAFNVTLLSSSSTAASVPSPVTIAAGQTSAQFTVSTVRGTQSVTVTISAILGTVTRTATVTVPGSAITDGTSNTIIASEPPPVPASLAFQSGLNFVASRTITGGQTQAAKVTLDRLAGGLGVAVALSSSNPVAATVPVSVTVPAGQNSVTFNVNTVPVSQTATVTISATVSGVSRTATLTISPASTTSIADGTSNTIALGEQPVPASVTFQSGLSFVSSRTITGGQTQQAKVTLDRLAGSAGVAVALNSSNPSVASVPASVTVPAGQNAATFNVSTVPVTQTATASISATVGTVTRSATLTVSPSTTSISDGTSNTIGVGLSFSLTPQQVQGGSSATAQIGAPASSPGLVVKLSAADGSPVTFPRSITFGAGEATKSVTIATTPVAQQKSITITASLDQGGTTLTSARQLTVLPPQLSAVTLSHASAGPNTTVTGKVALSGPAPADLAVALSISDTTAAKATTRVEFAPGSSTGTFSLLTAQVKAETTIKISVSLGSASLSAPLRVTP